MKVIWNDPDHPAGPIYGRTADGVHVVNGQGAELSKTILGRMLRSMPQRYLTPRGQLVWIWPLAQKRCFQWQLDQRTCVSTDVPMTQQELWRRLSPYGIRILTPPDFPGDRLMLTTWRNWETGLDNKDALVVAVNLAEWTVPGAEKSR
jgi:hypothetical protein